MRNLQPYEENGDVIAVILTTYNRRALLARALASVLAQTVADCEVIVVDDGSTDGTLEFLRPQPVTVIGLAHSGNPAVVRNAGLSQSRGSLIAFLDSDDVWQPTTLAELSAALEAHAQAGFAYCDYQPAPSPLPDLPAVGDVFDQLLESDFLVTGGVLLRRSAATEVGLFDPLCAPAEDWDYWLRLAARFPGVHVPRSLITIASHPDSLSRRPGGAIHRANIRVTRKALDSCVMIRPASTAVARRAHRRSLLAAARDSWQRRALVRTMGALMRVAVDR